MEAHLRGAGGKRARSKLIRRYGFGVPLLDRALRSANDALTLIAQSTIHPFSKGKMREMHVHQLPWPKETLKELGQTAVRLRELCHTSSSQILAGAVGANGIGTRRTVFASN
jgi:hypothetical protein